ncbi:ion channel domain-containing protein [Ditylenchus destructor]|nr:ion channel domain-containing protein [Ditylenchus destructor]
MQNSVLISDLRAAHPSGLRRKSAAFVLASTLRNSRRNSRVSISSIEATHQFLGQDGYINLFPFKNGIHASNDSFWANNRISRKRSCLHKFTTFLQTFYEKSRLHYLLPIIILVVYSFLGGFIFYSIENPEEQKELLKKKEYIQREEQQILREVLSIDQRLRALHEIRKYRTFAMNRLNKAVYWYVLQVYYLNDQESYKSSLLHPTNPEQIWKSHFGSSFGRIFALRNYTQQLSERCWEIGLEMNIPSVAYRFMEFVSCVKNAEKLKGRLAQERTGGMPVLLAIGVSFGWMFLCAAIFLKFEKDWDYFKSFYFFFCSLTTIGYGWLFTYYLY